MAQASSPDAGYDKAIADAILEQAQEPTVPPTRLSDLARRYKEQEEVKRNLDNGWPSWMLLDNHTPEPDREILDPNDLSRGISPDLLQNPESLRNLPFKAAQSFKQKPTISDSERNTKFDLRAKKVPMDVDTVEANRKGRIRRTSNSLQQQTDEAPMNPAMDRDLVIRQLLDRATEEPTTAI